MDNVTKFLVYCVEIYKTAYKLNGKQVMELFAQYEIPEYIVKCYGALHTTGPEYIIEDIAGLIADRQNSAEFAGCLRRVTNEEREVGRKEVGSG